MDNITYTFPMAPPEVMELVPESLRTIAGRRRASVAKYYIKRYAIDSVTYKIVEL